MPAAPTFLMRPNGGGRRATSLAAAVAFVIIALNPWPAFVRGLTPVQIALAADAALLIIFIAAIQELRRMRAVTSGTA